MKKNRLIILFVLLSALTYAQNANNQLNIKAGLIDSIIKLPNTTAVDISSYSFRDKFTNYQSRIFKIENDFLVIDNSLFFDLNKLIAFRRTSKPLIKGSVIELYFE